MYLNARKVFVIKKEKTTRYRIAGFLPRFKQNIYYVMLGNASRCTFVMIFTSNWLIKQHIQPHTCMATARDEFLSQQGYESA